MKPDSLLYKLNPRIYLYVHRHEMIGSFYQIKALDNRVNLYDYHPELKSYGKNTRYYNSRYNLGDYLGLVICEWMLQKKGLSLDTPIKGKKFLNTVGSNVFAGYQNCTLWGSGVLNEPISQWKYMGYYPFRKLDIRAVRGPLTRNVLLKFRHKCPAVYGDPAILMPLIYKPQIEKQDRICFIPQFYSEKELREKYPNFEFVSMNTNDYKSVIDAIVSSKKVVTSSLHGIILAEAYGVPASFFRSLGKNIDFKYLDYYYSTGRTNIEISETLEEALAKETPPLPDLKKMQQGLLESFPYDLWDNFR